MLEKLEIIYNYTSVVTAPNVKTVASYCGKETEVRLFLFNVVASSGEYNSINIAGSITNCVLIARSFIASEQALDFFERPAPGFYTSNGIYLTCDQY